MQRGLAESQAYPLLLPIFSRGLESTVACGAGKALDEVGSSVMCGEMLEASVSCRLDEKQNNEGALKSLRTVIFKLLSFETPIHSKEITETLQELLFTWAV